MHRLRIRPPLAGIDGSRLTFAMFEQPRLELIKSVVGLNVLAAVSGGVADASERSKRPPNPYLPALVGRAHAKKRKVESRTSAHLVGQLSAAAAHLGSQAAEAAQARR